MTMKQKISSKNAVGQKNSVAIIMGSKTDLPVMEGACDILKHFGIPFDVEIVSAHRTPHWMMEFAEKAHLKYSLIIAGAGGAAHLPGMVASITLLPVIGVPVQVGKLSGLDALLSIAQMPKGVPVACMAVDNAANGGLLAARVLALNDKHLFQKLLQYQKVQRDKVLKK